MIRGVTEKAVVGWLVGWISVEAERKKKQSKSLDQSVWARAVSLLSHRCIPLWTALIVNMKEGNQILLDTWSQEASLYVHLCAYQYTSFPFLCCCLQLTRTNRLPTNFLLLQLSNLIIFHQVPFCSASVSSSTLLTSFVSFSLLSLGFQKLAISGPCFSSAINNSTSTTTKKPSVGAWLLCSSLNCPFAKSAWIMDLFPNRKCILVND